MPSFLHIILAVGGDLFQMADYNACFVLATANWATVSGDSVLCVKMWEDK